MLQSPQANLFQNLIDRLALKVPAIRFIEQDLGQLENYQMRPAVSWPCCMIDIEEFNYSDLQNFHNQLAEGIVSLRIGLVKYTDSNNLTPTVTRENALQYYEIEQQVFTALHGWNPPGFSKLLRRASGTEKRDDDIRVRVLKFATSFTDSSAAPVTSKVPRPNAIINEGTI